MQLLLPVFSDPAVVKVLHGADSDIVWLQRDFGLYIVNLFDTGQVCCQCLGGWLAVQTQLYSTSPTLLSTLLLLGVVRVRVEIMGSIIISTG
eukprot:COSAG01_NODE_22254_length_864_cov_1.193464_1_plen_92_part_00